MNKSIFIIAAQFGGGELAQKFKPLFLKFKKEIESYCHNSYSDEIIEFSFIFRIDGTISSWGVAGCNRLRLNRNDRYLTIDIGITEIILKQSEDEIWQYIIENFKLGLLEMFNKIDKLKLDFNILQLKADLKPYIDINDIPANKRSIRKD